jgi:hypothetical protein
MTGTGVNRQDGGPTKFAMAWSVMKNGNIVEIWAAVDADDQEGGQQAATIVKSFKGR